MKKKVIYYSAMATAASLFTAVGSAGLALADGHDDDDDDEGDDDDSIVTPVCPDPSTIEQTIASEVNSSAAVVSAKSRLNRAEKALKTSLLAERKAARAAAQASKKAKTASAKESAKTMRSKYKTAKASTATALASLKEARKNLATVRATTESNIRSRYHAQCAFVDPTPTPTDTATATPTPIDTTGPNITPTPTPTTPTPTPTTPTPTPTTPTPTPTTPTPVTLSAPTNLAAGTATSLNTGAFRLTWDAVSGATSYKIFRDGVQIGSSTTTNFTPSVTAGARNSYTVVATDGTTDSPASAAINAGEYIGTSVADKRGLTTYGNIQVFTVFTDSRLTGCWATYPTSSDSGSINRSAIPTFCSEAIQAQSSNIAAVSGASATYTAFKTSLQAALTAAGL